MRGVILYGPPASGKDTITRELRQLDPAYIQFPRIKAGPGRTTGYRMTTPADIQRLRERGEVIWENSRYESVYVVDRPELLRLLGDQVPVVHLGQLEAVGAITKAVPDASWLTVYVHAPRDVAAARIAARRTGDDASRLRAWARPSPSQTPLSFSTPPRCLRRRQPSASTPPYVPCRRSAAGVAQCDPTPDARHISAS